MKYSNNSYKIAGLLVFILIPFVCVGVGKIAGFEGVARLISIMFLFTLFPLISLWIAFSRKIRKQIEFPITKKKKSALPIQVLALIFGIGGLLCVTFPMYSDIFSIVKKPASKNTGVVTDVHSTAYDLLLKAYRLQIDNSKEDYLVVYSTYRPKIGEQVDFTHLPKTRYVIDLRHSDNHGF